MSKAALRARIWAKWHLPKRFELHVPKPVASELCHCKCSLHTYICAHPAKWCGNDCLQPGIFTCEHPRTAQEMSKEAGYLPQFMGTKVYVQSNLLCFPSRAELEDCVALNFSELFSELFWNLLLLLRPRWTSSGIRAFQAWMYIVTPLPLLFYTFHIFSQAVQERKKKPVTLLKLY